MSRTATPSPYLTPAELAERWRTTANAIYQMRHKRKGPPSFRINGRVRFPVADVEAYEREHQAADSRWNPDLDPTRQLTESQKTRRKDRAVA